MEFEWDLAKDEANRKKHGISFEQAKAAFDDPFALDFADEFEDEFRSILLGTADGMVLFVVYTERPPITRIISARKANKHEQNRYYHENFS
jgi:uncharacterized protein